MRRRDFIALMPAILASGSGRVLAQSPKSLPRVGVLVSSSPPHPFADAFRRGLRNFGYTEGQNITLEFRYTGGRGDRAAELAAELVQLGVDMIVAHFTPAVKAAMAATRTIPIVMAPAGAPLQVGFVDNLARPGGNVTGLSAMDAEIGGKRLQLLRELIPNLASVGVLASTLTTDPYSGPYVADLRSAAAQVGVRLEPRLVSGPSEFETAFATMARAGAQAVIVQLLFDPQHRNLILELAAKHRLAFMSGNQQTAAAGALVSISADYLLLYERAASFVDKIIKGAKPGDLPVEQPTKFLVAINAKTARELGLNVSPLLFAQADEVLE
jgi:putative ABC transport system substrate-binding protein